MEKIYISSENELESLCSSANKIYLYGAGKIGNIIGSYIVNNNFAYKSQYITTSGDDKIVHGMGVLCIDDVVINENDILILCVWPSGSMANQIITFLEEKQILKINVLKSELINVLTAKTYYLKYEMPPTKRLRLEVHITEHCNLSCAYCSHFSPLADKEFISPEEMRLDFERLSFLCKDIDIEYIYLIGGEPLLHPEIVKIVNIAREYFKDCSDIKIITNGILLTNLSNEVWESFAENDIYIDVSPYPIKLDWDKILIIAKKHNVKISLPSETCKNMYCMPISKENKFNKDVMFKKCHTAGATHTLSHGRMYPCCTSAHIKHLNKYFKLNIGSSEQDSINIYEVNSFTEIADFLAKSIPLCSHCDIEHMTYDNKWRVSKKERSEWLV